MVICSRLRQVIMTGLLTTDGPVFSSGTTEIVILHKAKIWL